MAFRCVFLLLTGQIWWRLKGTETLTPPLESLGQAAVVSPLAIQCPTLPDNVSQIFALRRSANEYLFRCQSLCLAWPDTEFNDDRVESVLSFVHRFLAALRIVAGQAQLPRHFCAAF